jgi:hypothetical protein
MAIQKSEDKATLHQVMQLVEKLSPEDHAKLCTTLLEDQEDIRDAVDCLANPGRIWSMEEAEKELSLAG